VKLTRCGCRVAPVTTPVSDPQRNADVVFELHDDGGIRVGAVEAGDPRRPTPGHVETLGLLLDQRDDGVVGHRERLVRARHTRIYELLQSEPVVQHHVLGGSEGASPRRGRCRHLHHPFGQMFAANVPHPEGPRLPDEPQVSRATSPSNTARARRTRRSSSLGAPDPQADAQPHGSCHAVATPSSAPEEIPNDFNSAPGPIRTDDFRLRRPRQRRIISL